MNQPNPNPNPNANPNANANANPPTAAAIARMKEIFNDPSRSEDAIKCATKDEVQELMSDYNLTSKQITSEFRKMYKAEWIRKRRIISKKVNPTKTSPPIYSGLGYPFENCSFKRTNIPDREPNKKKHRPSRQATKCSCSVHGKQCVQSYDHFFEVGQVTCKNARCVDNLATSVSIHTHVKECTRKSCGHKEDCGNRYSWAEHHLSKCVVAKQFDTDGESSRGLKVRRGCLIPAWAVIGEYTGKLVGRGRKNKNSQYIVEIDKTTHIDARKEGNCTRFINHRCKDFNAVLVPVQTNTTDTVFVRSIKQIQENEFVTIHYGSDYIQFFEHCLCESCCPNAKIE